MKEVDPKSNKFSVTVHQHSPTREFLVSDKIFFMVTKKKLIIQNNARNRNETNKQTDK